MNCPKHAIHRSRSKILPGQETKWIDPSLSECPVNLCGSRTYIVMTRFANFSLIAAFLLLSGCYHDHYRDDGGWRDDDRGHRHHHRHDRDDDDDRQWRGDRYNR